MNKALESLTNGIELPSQIFSLAVESFDLETAIFFTFDKSTETFIPFSSLNIDETSLRRCRLSFSLLRDKHLVFDGTDIHLNVDKSFLKSYFSTRLWDSIDKLDMLNFNFHDKLYGILAVINADCSANPKFFDFASFFTKKCSEHFYNSKSSLLSNLTPDQPAAPPCSIDELDVIIEEKLKTLPAQQISTCKLIYINYKNILKQIIERNNSIDTFRVDNDVYKMFSSMLFGDSFIIRLVDSRLVLIFLSGLKSNNHIIENQMSTSLISLIGPETDIIPEKPEIIVTDLESDSNEIHKTISDFIKTMQ